MRTITVKGMGTASVKPDLIVVTMRIQTIDKDYEKMMDDEAKKLDKLSKSLEKIGFEKDAIKTTSFDVRTKYESVRKEDGSYKSVFIGYVCDHNLKIEFEMDMKKLAKVLSAIASCEAEPVFDVSFTVKDLAQINQELLKSASKNALEKAEVLCSASNVKLGKLVSIDYNWGEINVYSHTQYKMGRDCVELAKECASNIDITPDDIDLSDTATFVWEIV